MKQESEKNERLDRKKVENQKKKKEKVAEGESEKIKWGREKIRKKGSNLMKLEQGEGMWQRETAKEGK
jgi:hypothetical protein